jgi:hypothetical protein
MTVLLHIVDSKGTSASSIAVILLYTIGLAGPIGGPRPVAS